MHIKKIAMQISMNCQGPLYIYRKAKIIAWQVPSDVLVRTIFVARTLTNLPETAKKQLKTTSK